MISDEPCGAAVAAEVAKRGWARMRAGAGEDLRSVLLAATRLLGRPATGRNGQVIEELSPRQRGSAFPRSLSAIHGMGGFPLHTDGAHLAAPPRYILLGCERAGSSSMPTVLVGFDDLGLTASETRALSAAPFLVNNGRRSFYTTIADEKRMMVRYDRGCMRPATPHSARIAERMEAALASAPVKVHHWSEGEILVLDNWQVLHGRGLGPAEAPSDRVLLRVSVQ
jgi:Taurine catabolism dioxygenase TauD, TfdA family